MSSPNAGEGEKTKAERVPRGISPLALKLSDAIVLAQRVNNSAGGQASYDLFSQIVGNTKTSSSFQRKVAALRTYGIIEDRDNVVALSDLGNRITAPRNEQDDALAVKEAMLRIDLLARMFERHRGRLLPEDNFLNNILIQEFRVPREVSRVWVEHFKDALSSAKLSYMRPEGRTQVNDEPITSQREAQKSPPSDANPPTHTSAPLQSGSNFESEFSGQSLPVPLGRGRIARLVLPNDWSAKRDLPRLLKMLELSLSEEEGPEDAT